MDEIVVTANPYSYYDPFGLGDPFSADAIFWSLPNFSGTLADALAAAPAASTPPTVSIKATGKTPAVSVVAGTGDDIVVTGKRFDNVSTLIGQVNNYAPLATEMQEWHDNNVTWKVVFLGTSDFNKIAATFGKDGTQIRAFTDYKSAATHVLASSTVTTYVLNNEGTGSALSTDLTHELFHFTRNVDGSFTYPPLDPASKGKILQLETPVYNAIYHGKTVENDGSATQSIVISAPAANSTIYGNNGNDVISSSGGTNTLVAYNSNSYLIGGTGNDTYDILGSGVKVIKDSGGNNGLYVAWAQSAGDISALLNGTTLFLSPKADGVSPDLSPNRLVLENYSTSAFPTVQFTTAAGVRSFVRTSTLTGVGGGGRGGSIVSRPVDPASEATTSLAAALHVVGTPIMDFVDPFYHSANTSQLIQQLARFGSSPGSMSSIDHTTVTNMRHELLFSPTSRGHTLQ